MKKILSITVTLTLLNCAGNYRGESISTKMARYEDRTKRVNPVPNYYISDYRHKGSRMPASANSKISENNKNIYFLSLFEQYEAFAQLYTQHARAIDVCPVFHQPLLKYKEGAKKYSWSKKKVSSSKGIIKSIKRDNISLDMAIKDHMDRNFDELQKLCTIGQSDNYYIYENLITLTNKSNILKRNESGVNALLKTTLFYNETLLHAIGKKKINRTRGRTIASTQEKYHFTDEALQRVRATWAKSLFVK